MLLMYVGLNLKLIESYSHCAAMLVLLIKSESFFARLGFAGNKTSGP